jgi:hypothetical protein
VRGEEHALSRTWKKAALQHIGLWKRLV